MAALTIFIHGVGSNSNTWDCFFNVLRSDDDTSGMVEYIPNVTSLDECSQYYFRYDYKSKIKGSGALFDKAKEIFTGTKADGNITTENHVDTLKSFIDFCSRYFSTINIVAHSLGGVISMKLLIKYINNPIEKLDTVLMYGAPLKGSQDPATLMKVLGSKITTNVLQELIPESLTIKSLNQRIEKNKATLKDSYNLFYIKGDGDDRIIEIGKGFIEEFGVIESIPGGHSEIINPSGIDSLSFIYFKEFVYEPLQEILSDQKKNLIIASNVRSATFTPAHTLFLEDVGILKNEHDNKNEVTLRDIYVHPGVVKYYDINTSAKRIDSKKIISEFNSTKLLIAGEDQSGKTSLCKISIIELREKGYFPIYLSDTKNLYEGRIDARLRSAFEDQYNGCSFDNISPMKIVPVLDNFHRAKNKDRHIDDLSIYACTILIVDDLFSLNLSDNSLLKEYEHYIIKEYSPTLRNEIIKKWLALSDNDVQKNGNYEALDKKFELVEVSLGKVFGSGIMPAYPFFILTIISTLDTFEKPLDREITSQGYCYQALIYSYLKKQNVKNDDIDTYINFLTEFAYFFYKEKKKEISKIEFEEFLVNYQNQYNLTIKKEVLLKNLSNIQIISLDSFNNYSFCYPYLYYFFVAKYLAQYSDEETNSQVDDLIDSLHKNENAYILTFMSHHSKNYPLLDKLLANANTLYSAYEPSTLCTGELAFFDEKVSEIAKAVLPNGNVSPEQNRVSELEDRDKVEERNELKDATKSAVEDSEQYLRLRKSIKTVEVMGHIIKNRAGSLKKDKLEEIFTSAMDVNLRITNDFIELIKHEGNQEGILLFLKGRMKEFFKDSVKKKPSKDEMDKITVKLFWNMNFFMISTLINKTVHSLGSDKLIDIVSVACDKRDTPASYLIKHGILMWYKKNVRIDNIAKRVEKNDFSSTSKRIFDFMIVNHCSRHQVKARDLQKIESKLGIVTGKLKSLPSNYVKIDSNKH